MGQGGNINLINGTPYDWVTSDIKSTQMNAWPFPPTIPAGKTTPVRIEWNQNIFTNSALDSGDVTFNLPTGQSFVLQARATEVFTFQVFLSNIDTVNNAKGDTIPIGFAHDGSVNFVLSGIDTFTTSNVPVAWMTSTLPSLGQKKLGEICMPGTHNAGMSINTGGTALAAEAMCLCQSLSVGDQLTAGSRYFDIRPVIAGGVFKTGHYSSFPVVGWQGMNGQLIDEIVEQVNAFTAVNSELIILNLSHDKVTDTDYGPFSPDQWASLFDKLCALTNLVILPSPTTIDLGNLTLNSLISSHAAVLVLVEPGTPLNNYANRGFYTVTQIGAVGGGYSDTDDPAVMVKQQIANMSQRQAGTFFTLSWTLTQVTFNDLAFSIQDMAAWVEPLLYTDVLDNCKGEAHPNVIYVDYLNANRGVASLAMAVNSIC